MNLYHITVIRSEIKIGGKRNKEKHQSLVRNIAEDQHFLQINCCISTFPYRKKEIFHILSEKSSRDCCHFILYNFFIDN